MFQAGVTGGAMAGTMVNDGHRWVIFKKYLSKQFWEPFKQYRVTVKKFLNKSNQMRKFDHLTGFLLSHISDLADPAQRQIHDGKNFVKREKIVQLKCFTFLHCFTQTEKKPWYCLWSITVWGIIVIKTKDLPRFQQIELFAHHLPVLIDFFYISLIKDFFRPSTGIPVLHSGSHFRHGLLQLMIHTIDPLHDGSSNFGSYIYFQ